jgi:hypothetical protein
VKGQWRVMDPKKGLDTEIHLSRRARRLLERYETAQYRFSGTAQNDLAQMARVSRRYLVRAYPGRPCSPPKAENFYDVHALHISCRGARRVLRRVAHTPCVIGHTCIALGFSYRLRGPARQTVARRDAQRVSWRSTFSD